MYSLSSDFEVATNSREEVTQWLRERYSIEEKRRVEPRVDIALAALKAVEGDRTELLLERDILPKIELLDALTDGLGWSVFSRYPAEFGHPDAVDYWRIMAASLYAIGFSPERISQLFKKHPSLFANTVRNPGNVRLLFEWLSRDLGCNEQDVAKLVDKVPLLLQLDCESVLKPRMQFLFDLGLPPTKAPALLRRQPELLAVDSEYINERKEWLQKQGASDRDVTRLLASHPSALLSSIDGTLAPLQSFLTGELRAPEAIARRVLLYGALFTRSLDTIRLRIVLWKELGFTDADLILILQRFNQFLACGVESDKCQAKLEFLRKELRLPVLKSLVAFPQYISYSLHRRIAPRAAAALHFGGKTLELPRLAYPIKRFCTSYKCSVEEYNGFIKEWKEGQGKEWSEMEESELKDVCI